MKDLPNHAQIVDVRTPGEFQEGHFPGAINIPVDQLQKRIGELKKEQPVVAYCQSGNRSGMAISFLKGQGFDAMNGGGLVDMLQLKNQDHV